MTVAEDDPRVQRCGFAKLQGVDSTFEYFIRKYEVILGRRSNNTQADVVIGEHSSISRKHAIIRYNFVKGAFELEVLSKNGVTIEGTLHTPDSGPVALHSQDTITVSDQLFFFLLPKDIRRSIAERMVMQPPPGAPALPASAPGLLPPAAAAAMPPWAAAQPQINPLALATFSSLQQHAVLAPPQQQTAPASAQEQMMLQLAALQQQQALLQQRAVQQQQQQLMMIAAVQQQHAANGLGAQPPQRPPP